MADNDEEVKPMHRLDPPAADYKSEVRKPGQLLVQLLCVVVSFLPLVIWSFVEETFLRKPKSIRGKVVMVTGSARGLGSGFAEKFAELGCKVACVDLDEELNKETVTAINEKYPDSAKAYRCNVALSQEIADLKKAIAKDFGQVNVIIHNAGLIAGSPITDFDDIYLHGVVAVNLTSHFLIYREFLPEMIGRNEGHIVAVGSVASFATIPLGSMYCATKHGVAGLMETLYYELNERPNNKIRVSIVCPYFINTSAFYIKQWKSRLPELTIEETVNATVDGILKDKRVITIPSYYYHAIHILKLLPDRVIEAFRKIFYIHLSIPPMSIQKSTPLYRLLMKSVETAESIIRKTNGNATQKSNTGKID